MGLAGGNTHSRKELVAGSNFRLRINVR